VFFVGANNLPYTTTVKNKSYAPFGQLTWTPPILSDKLSLTGGIRYTVEQVHTDRSFQCVTVISGGTNLCNKVPTPGLNNWSAGRGKAFSGTDGLSPMGNIAFQWTDNFMTYFRVARGFKGGGFQGVTTDPRVFAKYGFDPEKLLQYEVGFKSQWLNQRLRFNAAGFYSDYTDMQISVSRFSPDTGTQTIISNAGSSEIWGGEFEVAAVPLRGLEVTASYALIDPKYKEWLDQKFDASNKPVFGPDGQPVLEDVKDRRSFPYAPKHQASFGLGYTAPPTASGVFSAHLDVYWQDKVTFIANDDTPGARADRQSNYALVNGRLQFVGIPLQKGSLDIAVFARNLFDKKYRNFAIDFGPSFGFSANNYGPPRTFGVQLTYNWAASEEPPAPAPAPVSQVAPPPPPAKKKIVLRSVHFDFDKATLRAEAKPILDEAVQISKQEGSVDIVVEGHTDSVGADQYNLKLSHRRAETVRRYLVEQGVAPARITTEGLGESKPVASNDTADGRAQNRRVELHVK
jgi:iron complex outermembrane receptor protein